MINRTWHLRKRPEGDMQPGDLELVEAPVREPEAGEVLIRTLFLSLDPTNRIWMSDIDQYLPPVRIDDPMRGVTLALVAQSKSDRFAAGDLVTPNGGTWSLYQTLPAERLSRVRQREGVPLSAHMSVFGPPGLTAWVGLVDIGKVKTGDTVTVSAAAGAVGSVAGQLAKARGCKVVGIAGGPRKCAWLVDELGFDAAIDYKSEDVRTRLRATCPDGIDVHFENVGGDILDAAIANMRVGGRIALCGLISSYNEPGPVPGPREFQRILMQRITLRGFIVIDHFASARDAFTEIGELVQKGALKWKDHVVAGLENAPGALDMLFTGKNDGKLMLRISEL